MSLINIDKKFIFIHIPKTAGKSIEQVSKTTGNKKIKRHNNIDLVLKKHPEAKEYFCFTCVRNPWSRLTSLYFYVFKQAKRKNQIDNLKLLNKGFEYFLQSDYFQNEQDWFDHLSTNQIEWIQSDSKKCDYIIKFENIKQDWTIVSKNLNLPAKLPITNKSKNPKDYKSMYNDTSKKLVANKFQQDIDIFKYTF